MFLDRANMRVQMTVVISVGIHLALLNMFGSKKFSETPRSIKLTEIEYQEEVSKPTEIEKLMTKLAAPSKALSKTTPASSQIEAIEELQRASFSKVVGVREQLKVDEITEADLTRLAVLPKLDIGKKLSAAPSIQKASKRIALVRSRTSASQSLESRVVPLDELPPADFGPEISRRGFQQPELIIKKVKAARREKKAKIDSVKQLSLRRDSFISGEVKNREILHREFPRVPRWLEEKGIEAKVVIRFVVNPDGEVGDKVFVEKTSGYAELDRLAIAALKKFIFAPLPLTARQAEQKGTIVIRFLLTK
ncbi:energy transducer TonB [bacterium]|nr:energy transducer TonB [bacterium]